ncbi:hypothetical protein BSKO_04424 [Bryopsis sp. KO-2023]|nr:hypothetical protein BSKO_04424 [Bryopsis sp. KO-2023]
MPGGVDGDEKGDGVDLNIDESDEVSLLPGKQRSWGGFPPISKIFRRKQGFERLEGDEEGRWCPEENAGIVSKLFFLFMDSLMSKGHKKHLDLDDLWDTELQNEAKLVGDVFRKNLESTVDSVTAPKGSVLGAIWKTHRRPFLLAGVIKVFNDLTNFLGPYLLEKLLAHMETRDEKGATPKWMAVGFFLAFAMLVTSISTTLLINSYFHKLYRVTIHLKAQLVHMLYEKSLRISSAAKTKMGIGAIVNLQSNDASNIWDLPINFHILWSGPFQITVILLMLMRVLGWASALAGFGMTLTLIPLNTVVGSRMEKYRKQMMTHTDERVKLTTEVIAGIKAIKLYAWEEPYLQKIWEIRELELGRLLKLATMEVILFAGFDVGPVIVSLVAFGTYAAVGNTLRASVAFPALALFTLLEFPLMMFPYQLMTLINGKVAIKRVQRFMETDDIEELSSSGSEGGPSVTMKNACFSWGSGEEPIISDLNLDAENGELVMVVGEVGVGKSSLLAALLNEMHKVRGSYEVRGSIATTTQDAWIQNMTLKENILMDKELDAERYAEVIAACALSPDIAMLPAGDATEIGEKGVNLSGGQKHRVALARACYANSDVFLLDDPLSAVDAHVGRHLFDKCICGLLSGKIRILVTHQLQFLPSADVVVVLEKGKATHVGSYAELVKEGVEFGERIMGNEHTEGDSNQEGTDKDTSGGEATAKNMSDGKGDLTKDENREVGQVKRHVYLAYFKSWGPCLLLPLLAVASSTFENGLSVSRNWWLSMWATKPEDSDTAYYLRIYFALGAVSICFTVITSVLIVIGSMNSSKKLVYDLLKRTLRLPMSFYDTQPSGRLINRFSKDTQSLDTEMRFVVLMVISCLVHALFTFVVIGAVTRIVIVAAVAYAVLYFLIQQRFVAATREMKRLDSIATSPIFSHFNATLQGLQTVRAFGRQSNFLAKNEALINDSNRARWPLVTANQWLAVRLQIMSALIVFFTGVTTAVVFETNPGLAGLAITSSLGLTGLMDWLVRQISQLEVTMNCVERVIEYEKYDTEKAAIVPENRPPESWPSEGAVTVEDVWVKYRPELEPVLKGISFSIKARERVGICGRTGCGKSTLMMTLFRIVEPYQGSIKIDGLEATDLGLFDLRTHLSLVPQDPVVFSGTIRSNLDPFDECKSDAKLWEALRQAGMEDHVNGLEGGLDTPISEGGQNLSVGQRQLLCMARALLRGSRILVLDEATSNVDNTTDSLIQGTIRSAFQDCTVLTIAHRLRTILDYDRIMVLDGGRLMEFDTPEKLMSDPNTMFSKLMEESTRGRSF